MRVYIALAVILFTSLGQAAIKDSCADSLNGDAAIRAQVSQKFKEGFNVGVFRRWVKAMDPLEPKILRALPLGVRLEAVRELWRKLHTYDYIKHIGVAFSDAAQEWQTNLIHLIVEEGDYESAWTQLSDYQQLIEIQKRIDQAESSPATPKSSGHIDVGTIDLQIFLDIYDDLPAQGQAILTGFAVAFRPSEADPLIDAWVTSFTAASPASREELIYFQRWGAGTEKMYRTIVKEWAGLTPIAKVRVKQQFSERGFGNLIP